MGNDGGSIPTRRELVKEAARNPNNTEAKAKLLESQTHAWTFCPLSERPLAPPIVSDSLGVLYNKDAVIEYVLSSSSSSDDSSPERKAKHDEVLQERVKSIRDVVEVKFKEVKDEVTKQDKKICPITAKELGPSTKSVYLVPCGHAYAELAVKEVPSETCMECNEPFLPRDVITILPVVEEDIQRMKDRMAKLTELGLTHSLKKVPGSKKSKKRKEHAEGEDGEKAEKKQKSSGASRSGTATPAGGIKNASTASLTAKVLKEQEEKDRRRKLGMNDNLSSLFSKGKNGSKPSGGDFMTRGYSLPKKA